MSPRRATSSPPGDSAESPDEPAPAARSGGCVFDRIRDGELAAEVVLDEPEVLAFLDHRPLFAGHTLVVPRRHLATLAELPPALAAGLFDASRRVAAAQREALGNQGTFVALNDVVSQSVPHVHLHVVPRTRGDGLRGFFWPRTRYAPGEATEVAARLRDALASAGGHGGAAGRREQAAGGGEQAAGGGEQAPGSPENDR